MTGLTTSGISTAVDYCLQRLNRAQDQAFEKGLYPSVGGKRRAMLERFSRTRRSGNGRSENDDNAAAVQAGLSSVTGVDENAWDHRPGFAHDGTGSGYGRHDPHQLGTALGSLVARGGWSESLAVSSVIARWAHIVGDNVAEHCRIERFEDAVLTIRTSSTAWSNQMRLLIPHVRQRIDDELGAGAVREVIIHGPQAPSWKHGRWSVQGRGPRDTYG